MTATGFIERFNALLEGGDHGALRATQVTGYPDGWNLEVTGVKTLRQLTSALQDPEVMEFIQSRVRVPLMILVEGQEGAEPTPAALVRDGKIFLVSGADSVGGAPASSTFSEWFQELIGAPLPIELDLVGIEENVWGTPNIRGKKIEGFPHALRVRSADPYSLVGFAGHGVNSYALYVTREQGATQMFLRLLWGGVYTNPQRARPKLLKSFVEANALFEIAAKKRIPLWLSKNIGDWSFGPTRPAEEDQVFSRDLQPVRDYLLNHPMFSG